MTPTTVPLAPVSTVSASLDELHVMGTVMPVRVTAAQTGGGLFVSEIIAGPGMGVPLHVHDCEDETFVVLEGRVEVVCGGAKRTAGPGEVVFGPRGVPHSWRVADAAQARLCLVVNPGRMEYFFRELHALGATGPSEAVFAICSKYGIRFLSEA